MESVQLQRLPAIVTRVDNSHATALNDLLTLIYEYSVEAGRTHLHCPIASLANARAWLAYDTVLLAHLGSNAVGAMILRREPIGISDEQPAFESLHTFAPIAHQTPGSKGVARTLIEAARDLAWKEGADLIVHFQRDTLTPKEERIGRRWLGSMGGKPCGKIWQRPPGVHIPSLAGISFIWPCPGRQQASLQRSA